MLKLPALLTLAAAAFAQSPNSALLNGPYHFVQISIPEDAAAPARNLGGSISFDAAGAYRIQGKLGIGGEAAADFELDGTYRIVPSGDAILLSDPAQPENQLELRFTDGAAILIGSSIPSGGDSSEMFLALKAPLLDGQPNAALKGLYAASYLGLRDGLRAGLASAFVELTADGSGRFTNSSLTGHAAAIDDVNRAETTAGSTYALRADGSGTAQFAEPSDILSGVRNIMVSAGGDYLLAYSIEPGRRDILFAVRKSSETAFFQFRGDYRIAEMLAENSFVFRPGEARTGAAAGIVRSDGASNVVVSEQVRIGGRQTGLTTLNRYSLGTTGSFGPALTPSVNNFALSANAAVFVGAQIAAPGSLTLEHGVFAGLRVPFRQLSEVPFLNPAGIANLTTPSLPALSVAPGALVSLTGDRLANSSASAGDGSSPLELEGVRVLLTGENVPPQPLPLRMISPRRIDVRIPDSFPPGRAALQVENNGALSNLVDTAVSVSALTLAAASIDGRGLAAAAHSDNAPVTSERPASPGETVTLYLTGLGARISEVQVLFDGAPGEVLFAGPAPAYPGIDQINVTLPGNLSTRGSAAVAVAATGSFNDLAELPVSSRQ